MRDMKNDIPNAESATSSSCFDVNKNVNKYQFYTEENPEISSKNLVENCNKTVLDSYLKGDIMHDYIKENHLKMNSCMDFKVFENALRKQTNELQYTFKNALQSREKPKESGWEHTLTAGVLIVLGLFVGSSHYWDESSFLSLITIALSYAVLVFAAGLWLFGDKCYLKWKIKKLQYQKQILDLQRELDEKKKEVKS